MRYVPSEGRLITLQRRAQKVGSILLAEQAISKNKIAEVVALPEDYEGSIKLGQKIYFDYSAGSIIEDADEGVYTVLDMDDILAFVFEE